MWLFFVNGSVWFLYNLLSKHGWRTTIFRRADLPGLIPMIQYYLRVRKQHPVVKKYNSPQKLAYKSIPFAGGGSILTGVAIYWPTQFNCITWFFGGYDTARTWHFLLMAVLVAFFFGHIVMVVIAGWWNFVSIISGWKQVEDH